MSIFEILVLLASFFLELIISLGSLVVIYVNLTNKNTLHDEKIRNLEKDHLEVRQNFKESFDEMKLDLKEVKSILMKDFVHLGNR